MKVKPNYILIPLLIITIATVGSLVTTPNINSWYSTLKLPSFAPAGGFIGLVWTMLYILIAISVILVWNNLKHDKSFRDIITIFLLNGFLNLFWSIVFFGWHLIGTAVFVSAVMAITIYYLIYQLYPKQKMAAYLLIPYGLWVTFATYLNFVIFTLNK